MHAMWTGSITYGIATVPVKMYAATSDHGMELKQIHNEDAGQISYTRTCTCCNEKIDFADVGSGHRDADGTIIALTSAELAELPAAHKKELAIEDFVDMDQIDPILFGKTYYLQAVENHTRAYALLREAMRITGQVAIARVVLRTSESLVMLRVDDNRILVQVVLWNDQVRPVAELPKTTFKQDESYSDQELTMACSMIDALSVKFESERYADKYQVALSELIESKREAVPAAAESNVVSLLSRLPQPATTHAV